MSLSHNGANRKIVSVADGDTFTRLVNNERIRIRLHGIDCPEKSQDFGQVAIEFLSRYVFGKTVQVRAMYTYCFGRTREMVSIEGVNVNEKVLQAGLAWHYLKYNKNPDWEY